MAAVFDPETLERLRTMTARQAFLVAREAVYRSGPVSSDDFADVYGQLVEEGILSWEEVEAFDR